MAWRQTINKVRQFDLTEVERFKPDVVFSQIGTNDLTHLGSSPASVGSAIEDLVCLLHHEYGVGLVCVGQTVKRRPARTFNANVTNPGAIPSRGLRTTSLCHILDALGPLAGILFILVIQ